MSRVGRLRIFFCILVLPLIASAPALAGDEARRLVALVDYIGGDYGNAVQGGAVVSDEEYREMKEFSSRGMELLEQLKMSGGGDKAGVESSLKRLVSDIEKKEDGSRVGELARDIKEKLITAYKIVPYPKRMPSLQLGKTVYLENCAGCHGVTGKGDGAGRQTMHPRLPPPANFTDPALMASLSPFRAFSTATFGVEGTAMPNFSALSDEERWQVAFYLFSLRFPAAAAEQGKKLLAAKSLSQDVQSVAALSTLTDRELEQKLRARFPAQQEALQGLAYLRRGLLEEGNSDPLTVARIRLREAATLYRSGEREKAYQKAIEAYLDGFELAEPALFAKDLSFGRSLESRFTQFRNSVRRGDDAGKIDELSRQIEADLSRASRMLSADEPLSDVYFFLNGLLIILREGLEAALILAAILALLKVMGAAEATRYIHLGWILAVFAGLLTWVLAETVLTFSGSHREVTEGLTTVSAAIVLFYVGYWLHTKAEARKWQKFVQEKIHGALTGRRVLALVGVSFFAVYREAFEVVLFYQALWLQSPDSHRPVIWGFLCGVAALSFLVVALLRLGLKIPIKYFFGATGSLLYLLAFVFIGQGVKELQAAGWFSVTPLRFPPPLGTLGIYPTLETLAAQGFMLLALFATLLWVARQRQKHTAD